MILRTDTWYIYLYTKFKRTIIVKVILLFNYILQLVQRIQSKIVHIRHRAMKFGTIEDYANIKIFRRMDISDFAADSCGSHFSKWPPLGY